VGDRVSEMVLSERMQALGDQARSSRQWHADQSPKEKQDDAAKAAVIHEWENWAALNPDDLESPDVCTYFFSHLQQKKVELLNFRSENKWQSVHDWLLQEDRVKN
jgi:hypothetical protein